MTDTSRNSPVDLSTNAPIAPIAVTDSAIEVLTNREIEISGTANFNQVANVFVKLPDNTPVTVQVNPLDGTWKSKIAGFPKAAATFVKVQAVSAGGQLLQELIVNILIKEPDINLVVKQNTIFKASPADSATLATNARVAVRAGQKLEVVRYGAVDGHIKVLLRNPIAPVGVFGYFYGLHVDLQAPTTITIKQDTVFKASTASSMALSRSQKVSIKAGTELLSDGYEVENNHIKVKLKEPIAPLGQVGYIFLPHVELSQLGESLDFSAPVVADIPIKGAIATVNRDTFLKVSAEDAANLSDRQKLLVKAGTTYSISGYASVNGHFRVKFVSPIPPVGDVGFFFWQHLSITKDGKPMLYDPEMKTLTVKQNTIFKKRAVDGRQLAAAESATLTAGDVFGMDSYSLSGVHFQVTLNEEVPPLGKSGFVFTGHVNLQQNNRPIVFTPKRKVLGVPYFSQLDNPRDPFVTCNVTSIAMVLAFYGQRSRNPRQQLEDELYQWVIDRYGRQARTDNDVLQKLYNAYGYKGNFATSRTWTQINQEILANRPVVIGGYFTHGGHIITIIGFDERGYIVHDPYGNALTGYSQTEGKSLRYPYIYMRDMCGVDGDVWAHFILPKS
ncbi:MAG: hypothetical protein DCE90_08420 [Pseudanabaena sp.]|nr:MAG: hypothetical protein DCE90_08420 [Pseudanabaena sp.]